MAEPTKITADWCGDTTPHGRHEWLDGARRADCHGTVRAVEPMFQHSDAELERPWLLSDERLVEIAQGIMQRWGGTLEPGARRFQRNGGIAVAELGLRLSQARGRPR